MSFALEPEWAYLHLELLPSDSRFDIDLITWKLLINRTMSQFLGVTGESIPVDILKTVDDDTAQAWIRVPEPDLTAVWTALSGATCPANLSQGPKEVSIRVVRATRHLMGIAGPQRGHWG
uniref:ARAD1B22396p n=1 Tax=Blastobotrys adeninivorans TaxID=409370 RepID=A0A060T7B8_BLAAD